MKLREIRHQTGYEFFFKFENGEGKLVDLKDLISDYVDQSELVTAEINQEWGCLEFKNGKVDIEPKTLCQYAYSPSKNQN